MNIEIMEPELHKLNFKFWKTLYQELINAHFIVITKSVWNSMKVNDGEVFFFIPVSPSDFFINGINRNEQN